VDLVELGCLGSFHAKTRRREVEVIERTLLAAEDEVAMALFAMADWSLAAPVVVVRIEVRFISRCPIES